MAVGIPVPHLQFEENRRQEEEDQSLDEAHQQLNRQKREYAQGAEDGSEHVGHGVNDRKYYAEAARRRGITGDILLQLLELRLDNVVYRLGFSNTRAGARQLVSHGHITVNGKKTNVASYSCRPGDVIAVGGKASSQQLATRFLDLTQATVVPDWLECDRDKLTGKIARVPSKEEIAPIVNEQLIVEFYSR